MPAKRIAGRLYFKVDGVQYSALGSFEYSLGGWKRTNKPGADGIHGYTEEPIPAYVQGDITDRKNLSLAVLAGLENVTVTLELANQKTVVIPGAWNASDHMVNASEGMTRVRFESDEEGVES